ncbi:MAG: hypothetical protein IJI60_03975 [Bacilli bacterium]|nr:hypothetical protein [Bacilli bacterium]
MKKSDKVFLIFFLAIVTFSMLYLFQASYAKYRRQAQAQVDATVASWDIKVNTESINNRTVLTNSITPTLTSDPYIKSGVIAPGSEGYFTISIDATNVDVDFTYEIQCTPDLDTPLYDIKFTQYATGGSTQTWPQSGIVTGDITKNSSSQTITIYFEWDDDPATTVMDNQDDTEFAIDPDNATTKIDVQISFTQKRS